MILQPTRPEQIYEILAGVSPSSLNNGFALLPLRLTPQEMQSLKALHADIHESSTSLDNGTPLGRLDHVLARTGAADHLQDSLREMLTQQLLWGNSLRGLEHQCTILERGYPEGAMNPDEGFHPPTGLDATSAPNTKTNQRQVKIVTNLRGPGPQIPISTNMFGRLRNQQGGVLKRTALGAQASAPCLTIIKTHKIPYYPPECQWHHVREGDIFRQKRLFTVMAFGTQIAEAQMHPHLDPAGNEYGDVFRFGRWLWISRDGALYDPETMQKLSWETGEPTEQDPHP